MSLFNRTTMQPSQTGDVPDLDVTPVMNLLVILIPFLVSMAVFTRLAVLEFSLPSNIGSGTSVGNEKPEPKLTVVVADAFCSITLGETMLDSIPIVNNSIETERLRERLTLHRASVTRADEIIVAVRNNVEFEQVVRVMDTCKNAGFTKIGLSNATENPHTGV